MSKKLKRIMSVVLCMMIIGTLSACGNETQTPNETEAKTETSAPTQTETAAGEEAAAEGTVKLPIVDEPTTITAFTVYSGNTNMEGYNDNLFFQELEKRTGIHIEFFQPTLATAVNSFEMMFTGGDITDLIMYSPVEYKGGEDAAVEDGAYLDLTELIPQYMPNYYKLITSREDIYRDVVSDSGKLVGVYQLYADLQPQGSWYGTAVRKDWLDECGLDIPVTYDDWTEMLTAFKEKYNDLGYCLPNRGYAPINGGVNTGFGVTESFIQNNGKVTYGPIEEGWREYATLMNQWYNDGLINKEFMATAEEFLPDMANIAMQQYGAVTTMYTMGPIYSSMAEGSEWVAVPQPVKNEGDVASIRNGSMSVAGGAMYISGTCKNPEIILQMLDYLYTEEGKILQLYGVEGISYTVNENGEYTFTDIITNNEKASFTDALDQYTLPSSILRLNDWRRDLMGTPVAEEWANVWNQATTDSMLPTFDIPEEYQSEYTSIMTDVESYRDEMIVKFITGQISIEEGWDAYIEQMKALKIDRAIEIYQLSYDAYLSKGK